MNKQILKSAALLVVLLLLGCTTTPVLKKDIKSAEIKFEGLSFDANYQELLKCWDENSSKQSIDGNNATYTKIYPDLGMAEIYTRWGDGRLYGVLFELIAMDKQQTTVNAYGTGYIGEQRVPEWITVLNMCAGELS